MGRPTRALAALAVTATPVLGVVAAVQPSAILADNGVIHAQHVGGPGPVRVLADNGVINSNNVGGLRSVVAPADDGVVSSRN